MYFNIHTHRVAPKAGEAAIVNVLKDFDTIPAAGNFSAGLHPWYLNHQTVDEELTQLSHALQKNNVYALGECGLDKVCDTDYQLQQYAFRQQIMVANKHHKPMILHCVKAFDDMLQILSEPGALVPVVFHGYHKSPELALQLIHAGYYLSFGKHILQPAAAAVFKTIQLNHVFLETDAADMEISRLYAEAAAIKQIAEEELEHWLAQNVEKVFGKIMI